MWIAEEFIIPKGRETLEDAASSCLQELVQRCMLQVSDRIRTIGTIKSCRVHDLLRDVAINEAKEERFLSVNPQENTRLKSRERRVAIYSINNDVMHHYAPNIRSLLSFGVQIHQGVKYRLLQVLELNNLPNKILLNEITNMIHLRYLGLRHTKVDRLPENIGRLQNLDINGTGIKSVPMSLWDIKSLRHVRSYVPLNGPPKQANLSNLQTVSIFVGAWEEDFPRLDNVRYLRINNKECNRDWNPAAQMLQRMKYLRYLYVLGNSLSADVVNMNTFQSYKCIQLLELDGEWPNNLSLNASQLPCHVTILTLSSSRFEQDPMLELKKLQNLKSLCLDKATTCKKMICSRGGFHRLEELSIYSLEILEEFYVEEGSLPVLKDLCIGDCKELRMLPDLWYVPSLTKLELLDMSEELVKRTNPENGEDWHKIKRIQLISLNFINLREGNQ
ncbi:hypothetical protein LUZ60_007127 [Juncus effusus]|nr:hypothetical protein LUZ60_007127 [Juncus effusus]